MGSTFGYSWCNGCGCIVCAVGCVVGCVFIFGCSTTVLLFYGLFYAYYLYCLVFTYYCFYAFSYYCFYAFCYCCYYFTLCLLLLIGCTTFSTSILSISSLSKSSTTLLILVPTFFYFSFMFFLFLAVVLIVGFDIVGFIYYSY